MPSYRINKIDLVRHIATGIQDNLDGFTPIESIPDENIIITDGNGIVLPYISTIGAYHIVVLITDSQQNTTTYEYDTYVTFTPDTTPPVVQTNNNVIFTNDNWYATMYIDLFNTPSGFITISDIISYLGINAYDASGTAVLDVKVYNNNVEIIGNIIYEDLYSVVCTAVDQSNNTAEKTIALTVTMSPDILPPIISFTNNVTFNITDSVWESSIELDLYVNQTITLADVETYLIASVVDNRPPYTIVPIVSTSVNDIYTPGEYVINIKATDVAGNSDEVDVYLTVNIITDLISPIIELNTFTDIYLDTYTVITKADLVTILINRIYDYIDGDITPVDTMISINNNAISSINTIGAYDINITVADQAGNITSLDLNITVVLSPDLTPPIITWKPIVNTLTMQAAIVLMTYPTVSIDATQLVNDLILNVSDNRDSGPFVIDTYIYKDNTEIFLIEEIGSYVITFSTSDSAGNNTVETVNLILSWDADTTPPIITLSNNVTFTTQWESLMFIDTFNGNIITKNNLLAYLVDTISDDRGIVLPEILIYKNNQLRSYINAIGSDWRVVINARDPYDNLASYEIFLTIELSPDTEPPYILWTNNVMSNTTTMVLDSYMWNNTITTANIIDWTIYKILDNRDGEMSLSSIVITDEFLQIVTSITSVGTYVVTYGVEDLSNNIATYNITLLAVLSPDTTAPIINDNSIWNSNISMYEKILYLDHWNNNISSVDIISALNIVINDNRYGNVTPQIIIKDINNVVITNITTVGAFMINISGTDGESNIVTKIVKITVTYSPDITPPVIYWNTQYVNPFSINPTIKTADAEMILEDFTIITYDIIRDNLIDYIEDARTGIITDVSIVARNESNQLMNYISNTGDYNVVFTTHDGNNNWVSWNVNLLVKTNIDLIRPVLNWTTNVVINTTQMVLDQYGFIITKQDIIDWSVDTVIDPPTNTPIVLTPGNVSISNPQNTYFNTITQVGFYIVYYSISDTNGNITNIVLNLNIRLNSDHTPPEIVWANSGNLYISSVNPLIGFGDLNHYGIITKEDIIMDLVVNIIDYYVYTIIPKTTSMVTIISNNQAYNYISTHGTYNLIFNVNDSNNNYATYIVELTV